MAQLVLFLLHHPFSWLVANKLTLSQLVSSSILHVFPKLYLLQNIAKVTFWYLITYIKCKPKLLSIIRGCKHHVNLFQDNIPLVWLLLIILSPVSNINIKIFASDAHSCFTYVTVLHLMKVAKHLSHKGIVSKNQLSNLVITKEKIKLIVSALTCLKHSDCRSC